MSDSWIQELEKMLITIEDEIIFSLQNIKNSFEQSGQSFHQTYQQYFHKRALDK